MDPQTLAIKLVQEPLEKAFSGSGFFYPLKERKQQYERFGIYLNSRNSTQIFKDDPWHEKISTTLDFVYDTIYTKSMTSKNNEKSPPNLINTLEEWAKTRKQFVDFLQANDSFKDIIAKDSTDTQSTALELHGTSIELARNISLRTEAATAQCELIKQDIKEFENMLATHRRDWVEFAEKLSKEADGAYDSPTPAWIEHLPRLSDFIELCELSLPLLHLTVERLADLVQMDDRPVMKLQTLPELYFDIYGNILAGDSTGLDANTATLLHIHGDLFYWSRNYPKPDTPALYSLSKKTCSGTVGLTVGKEWEHSGDDLTSAKDAHDEDILKGIEAFDFVHTGVGDRYGDYSVNLKLSTARSHPADRVWEKSGSAAFASSRLSWIHVPKGLRNHAKFGQTSWEYFQATNIKWCIRITNENDGTSTTFLYEGPKPYYTWTINFPAAFESDSVVVHPWLMDLHVYKSTAAIVEQDTVVPGGVVPIKVVGIGRTGFKLKVLSGLSDQLQFVRVGYAAYETTPSPIGIHCQLYKSVIPQYNVYVQTILKPTFFRFPAGKFRRRPAAAAMLSQFKVSDNSKTCVNVRYAFTRDGILIQGYADKSTTLVELGYLIVAISNDEDQRNKSEARNMILAASDISVNP